MCGLAGIVTYDGAPVEHAVLRRMAATLRHRGPDAEGFYSDSTAAPGVFLAHCRLAVIDLSSAADQPLGNEDGSVQVALNGEIYNFRELRRGLRDEHRFGSQGDSEVVAHLYEERGAQALPLLDGMFALVIWDQRRRRLLLARDATGKKPLYYWSDARRLVFASEIKALLAAGVPVEFDEANLGEYLGYGYVPTPRSLFRGVRKLPPASLLEVGPDGPGEPRSYWDLRFPDAGAAAPLSLEDAAAEVRDKLTDAVRKRLVSDVPLGVLLSGGVDSSAVAALTARLTSGRVQTFTVGFEGHAFYDERPYAELVARHIGSEHHSTVVRPDAAELLDTLLHHHDEPFGDSSALPTFLVAREARRHVTVVLNGDGGDEAFAGYDRFWAAQLAEDIPRPVLRAVQLGARWLPPGGSYHGLLRRLRRFADKATLPFHERIFSWHSFFDLETIEALDAAGVVSREALLSSCRSALDSLPRATLLSRLLYLNVRTYLLDDLLPKMDRMTMAHGLEARSPLLDRALLETAAGLDDRLKRRAGRGKIVLKKAVQDLVPSQVLTRRKHGFGLPIGAWFRADLRALVADTLLAAPRLATWLDAEGVRRLVAEHQAGRVDHGHRLWTLLTLELWLRKHGLG